MRGAPAEAMPLTMVRLGSAAGTTAVVAAGAAVVTATGSDFVLAAGAVVVDAGATVAVAVAGTLVWGFLEDLEGAASVPDASMASRQQTAIRAAVRIETLDPHPNPLPKGE